MVIAVEIWGNGYRERRKEIAQLAIWNISDLAETSDYRYALFEPESDFRVERPSADLDNAFLEIPDVAERLSIPFESTIAWGTVRHRREDGWGPLVRDVLASVTISRTSGGEVPIGEDGDV